MLTFKQYLESKQQLIKALEQTPTSVNEYEVKKYCSISTGPSIQNRQVIGLKPKQKIIIEWLYEDINSPRIVNIRFKNNESITEDQTFTVFWTTEKVKKWLAKNTKEGIQNGF